MTADQLLGLPLEQAELLLREHGISEIEREEYRAPGRQRHGEDLRVIQARLGTSCATLIYSGFNTELLQETASEGDMDGDND